MRELVSAVALVADALVGDAQLVEPTTPKVLLSWTTVELVVSLKW